MTTITDSASFMRTSVSFSCRAMVAFEPTSYEVARARACDTLGSNSIRCLQQAAVAKHPAGCAGSSPICGISAVAFGGDKSLGTRDVISFVGSLFIFYNARKNRLKVLFYDATGYCLLYKRFDRGVFHLPVVIDPLARELEVSAQEMAAMLRGLDVPADRPRRVRKSIKKEQLMH